MKPFDPSFVRRLRQGVRTEVMRDRTMWRESNDIRRVTRSWSNYLWPFFLPVLFLGLLARQPNVAVGFGSLTIWALVAVVQYARNLQAFTMEKEGLMPFYTQPVSNEFAYTYGWRGFLRKSIGILVAGLLVFSIVALNTSQGWSGIAGGIVCATLLWLTTVASAVILFRYWPRARFGFLAGFGTTGCLILLMVSLHARDLSGLIEGAYPVLRTFTPAGWICGLAEWGLGLTTQLPLTGAVITVGVIGYAIMVEPSLRQGFTFFEGDLGISVPKEELGVVGENEFDLSDLPTPSREQGADETAVALRRALAPIVTSDGGPIERLVLHGFSPREFTILDFLLGEAPGWSRRYWRGAVILLVLLGLFYAASALTGPQVVRRTGSAWIYWVTAIIALLHMMPIFSGFWRGLDTGVVGNRAVAFLAMLPVGAGEARCIILRINRLRVLLASPWILAVVFTYARLDTSIHGSVGIALVCVSLLWAFLPLGLAYHFSIGTNDTQSSFWFKALGLMTLLLILGLGLSAFFTAMSGRFLYSAVSVLLFAAVCQGMYAAYFYRYRTLRFDTMATIQE
jgi:hypothetical protein